MHELENGDKMTIKTTDGETFVLWVKKADREHIIGYKDLELDLHVLSVAKIKEMYPVQVKDRLKIYAENGEVTKMKVLTLEKNNILGIGRTRHLGTKKYSPKQNYQISFSDIEKIESLTFTTHHSGFMIHL